MKIGEKMDKCRYFRIYETTPGKFESRCIGTKEQRNCSCRGIQANCDFYTYLRETTPQCEVSAVDFLQTLKEMCNPSVSCHDCALKAAASQTIKTEYCPIIDLIMQPKEFINIVSNWKKKKEEPCSCQPFIVWRNEV